MKVVLSQHEIERCRARRGWLKSDLAKEAGVHMATITKVTRGRPVGVVAARKVCLALGRSVRGLIANTPGDHAPVAAAG